MNRPFDRMLVIGTLAGTASLARLEPFTGRLDLVDPSPDVAAATGARCRLENDLEDVGAYDAVIALGTLDTVATLPETLARLRFLLKPDSPLLGVVPGGQTLPRLRAAMHAADQASGRASPHIHPRIEPSALAALLAGAGLAMPVVDIDRIALSYRGFPDLLRDLRALGATNLLFERDPRPLSRSAYDAAAENFMVTADARGRVVETFELLHFVGWTPSS